jgi:hypothetical protein
MFFLLDGCFGRDRWIVMYAFHIAGHWVLMDGYILPGRRLEIAASYGSALRSDFYESSGLAQQPTTNFLKLLQSL